GELTVDGPSPSSMVAIAVAGQPIGVIALRDRLKPSARPSVDALKEEGLEIHMATGDLLSAAASVAKELGLSEVRGEVRPEQKAEMVGVLKAQGRVVAMAGDGVNDAPALAAADVGLAMGTGTDVAIESAGIVLLKGDLRGIVRARRLSRRTLRN